jgi:hypothetical protein
MKTSSSQPAWTPEPFPERRSCNERRQPTSFPPRFSSFRRRRSRGRRKTDPGGYVDIYDRGSWIVALTVMALSFVDAVLTVLQVEKGIVREANPIMNVVLAWGGAYAFFSLKAAMTAFALAIIIIHKEWVLARYMARLCLICYILILIYHMYLVNSSSHMLAFL